MHHNNNARQGDAGKWRPVQASLCIFHGPARALANAALNGDEATPFLRLVGLLAPVPEGHSNDCLMSALFDELLLGAGSVGGRCPDTQHLLDGLQHCALATAVLTRHKVDVGAADRARPFSRT